MQECSKENIQELNQLNKYLQGKDFSQIFILVDDNTSRECLPILVDYADFLADKQANLLEVSSQEKEAKNITTALSLIDALLEARADRKACLIALGGGMITDLGGFVASIYKRGIQVVNVPTTLIGMVDASIGGKTAVNYKDCKNIIGTFNFDTMTFLCDRFLDSLDKEQVLDGVAEMLKTFLVSDAQALQKLMATKDFNKLHRELIIHCANIKQHIVEQDPYDYTVRKKLNFGHTIGHALEAYYQGKLSHGHAVAVGMYYALELSKVKLGFSSSKAAKIQAFISKNYEIIKIKPIVEGLLPYLRQDKKNDDGKIMFVLLDDIASCQIDIPISERELMLL